MPEPRLGSWHQSYHSLPRPIRAMTPMPTPKVMARLRRVSGETTVSQSPLGPQPAQAKLLFPSQHAVTNSTRRNHFMGGLQERKRLT